MSCTLLLMRHAKSSWATPGLDDHARPLNSRGQRSASALGDWLRSARLIPDQIQVSTARRTQETLAWLGLTTMAEPIAALYHASPSTMLQVLQQASGQTVLMLGHNPGIAMLARLLVTRWPGHDRFKDYPTGATLVVRFDIDDWANVALQSGQVIDFVIPQELLSDEQGTAVLAKTQGTNAPGSD